MNLRKIMRLTILLNLSCILVACGNDNGNNIVNESDIFKDKIINLISIYENSDYDKSAYNKKYKKYVINDNVMYGYNYNDVIKEYDYNLYINLNDYYNFSGQIIEDLDGKTYVSVKNEEFCAIKDFEQDDIKIFSIEEEEKCHINYIDGDNIYITIANFHNYDNSLSLQFISNVLDNYGCKYKIYKNGKEISVSDVPHYKIFLNDQISEYYVEIIIPNGKSAVSLPVIF